MDKTEQFIKMADCPEVQKYRKGQKDFQVGDLIANYLLGKYSKANFQGIVIFEQHDEIRNRQLAVWLPRQDDIQEMYGWIETSIPNITLAMRFAEFCDTEGDSNVDIRKGSMEQLWLAFYMYEKHKKIWDGEKWIKK